MGKSSDMAERVGYDQNSGMLCVLCLQHRRQSFRQIKKCQCEKCWHMQKLPTTAVITGTSGS